MKRKKINYPALKVSLALFFVMAVCFKANAQVLVSWDSSGSTLGAVVAKNNAGGYQFAAAGIEWEVGLWSGGTVDTTDRASILNSFASWKSQNASLYSGVITADGQFSGSSSSNGVTTAILNDWVGKPGSSFGIVFGRNANLDTGGLWGAFRFSTYAGGNFLANIAPPNTPPDQPPFELSQIDVSYVPTGTAGAPFIINSLGLDMTSFGDQDLTTDGNQYLVATQGILLIPEPSSASLLAVGLAGLVALRKRRKY